MRIQTGCLIGDHVWLLDPVPSGYCRFDRYVNGVATRQVDMQLFKDVVKAYFGDEARRMCYNFFNGHTWFLIPQTVNFYRIFARSSHGTYYL